MRFVVDRGREAGPWEGGSVIPCLVSFRRTSLLVSLLFFEESSREGDPLYRCAARDSIHAQ